MAGPQVSESERAAADMDRTVTRDSSAVENLKGEIGDYDAVVEEARDASQIEQTMTVREAARLYPKAIAWSMLLSTAIIMEGYGELGLDVARTSPLRTRLTWNPTFLDIQTPA